jgi:hypothetical protein
MTLLTQLVDDFADVLGVHQPTVSMYARNLRDHGLVSKKGRGRGAAHMTPLDAARLLIALLATTQPIKGPRAVEDFGQLLASGPKSMRGEAPAGGLTLAKLCGLPERHTLEQAVAGLIASFDWRNVDAMKLLQSRSLRNAVGMRIPPITFVAIRDTWLEATVVLDDAVYQYRHAALVEADSKDSDEGPVGHELALRRWGTGIASERRVATEQLCDIGMRLAERDARGRDDSPEVQSVA